MLRIAFAALLICVTSGAIAQEPPSYSDSSAPNISPVGNTTIPATAGKVELVEGEVYVYNSARKVRTVKAGDVVAEGDSIVTGKDGELHLNMDDGGFIAVRPNTKMRIVNFRAQGDDGDRSIRAYPVVTDTHYR